MATTTTLERLRDAVDDLRHTLSVIEYGLDALEAANSDSHNCECRHPRKWHKSPTHHHACQTPDCPCRKFEPAGGAA